MKTNFAALIAFSILAPCAAFAQLSITNYQLVSQQTASASSTWLTYRADLVNSGAAMGSVTASASTTNPFVIRLQPGLEQLNFTAAPANSQVTSSNTFAILVTGAVPPNFNLLQWTFQATSAGPLANAGANQTAVVGQTVTLNGSGSSTPTGTLSYSWQFASRPPASTTVLMNPSSVLPSFVVDVAGTYTATLTVNNGTASSTASVMVSTEPVPPLANAGPYQTVALDATVVLNGSGSSNPNGTPITYSWTLATRPSGSTAALVGANTVSPTFVADQPGTYVAQLMVSDGILNSTPATVTISTQNTPPEANPGSPQVVDVGSTVQLNGSGSTDVDGDPLTYQWSLISVPNGSAAVLNNPASVNPTFEVDVAGTYVAQLIVNDGLVSSQPQTVTISTTSILPPTANAGPSQTVPQGATVSLNGGGTDPQYFELSFQWSLISRPPGSKASLSSATLANPTFVVDLPGTYIAQLIVSNGVLSSAPALVTIATTTTPPTANAGTNQSVTTGSTVTLNGSLSSDPAGHPLTYSWSLTTTPSGSKAVLLGAAAVSPTFTADLAGTYVAQLIVSDGISNSNPATVMITATTPAGLILPANVVLAPGQSVSFPVTLGTPAPPNGLYVTLTSSNPTAVTVTSSFEIPGGATAPLVPPKVNGVNAGSATITASAQGFAQVSQTVQNAFNLSFSASALSISGGTTQQLYVSLLAGTAPAGGLTINVSSTNPAAATVPATVVIAAGATTANVPVKGVGAGSAVINASAPGISAITANVTVSGAITYSIAATGGLSQTTCLNTPFGSPLVATVMTSNNTPASGLTVTFTAPSANGTVSFANGVNTAVTNASGIATSGMITANGQIGNYTVTASVPGATAPASFSLINAGCIPPALSALSGTPQTASINGTFSAPLVVTLAQNSGQTAVSGVTVTFTAPPSGASGTFANGINTAVTNASGIATSGLFTANGTAGSYAVVATAAGSTAASFSLTNCNNCSAASIAATSGTPQTVATNLPFGAPLVVTVMSAANTPVSGATVTFSAPSSGATGTFAGGVNTAVTNANGVAQSAIFTANGVGGTYTVTATVQGAAAAANFTLTNTALAPNAMSITGGVSIGQYLEVMGTVTVGTPAPAGGLVVTFVANNITDPNLPNGGPRQAQLSVSSTSAVEDSITVTIPAGSTSGTYYLQGEGNTGTVTYTASATGYVSQTATITCSPSAVVIAGPAGLGQAFSTSLAAYTKGGPASPITVSMAQLDASNNFAAIQMLGTGNTVSVSVSNSNSTVGRMTTPITISAGTSSASGTFTPFATGSAVISIVRSPTFGLAKNDESLAVTVTP